MKRIAIGVILFTLIVSLLFIAGPDIIPPSEYDDPENISMPDKTTLEDETVTITVTNTANQQDIYYRNQTENIYIYKSETEVHTSYLKQTNSEITHIDRITDIDGNDNINNRTYEIDEYEGDRPKEVFEQVKQQLTEYGSLELTSIESVHRDETQTFTTYNTTEEITLTLNQDGQLTEIRYTNREIQDLSEIENDDDGMFLQEPVLYEITYDKSEPSQPD